eukprot:scaffold2058_cov158-Alexandrium_tamarense.AAC.9
MRGKILDNNESCICNLVTARLHSPPAEDLSRTTHLAFARNEHHHRVRHSKKWFKEETME